MITTKQRSQLKALSNSKKPEITIGKEQLTPNVLAEVKNALFHRELVKVAALKSCTLTSRELLEKVCETLECDPVLCVGNRFVIYKRSDKEDIKHIIDN